MGTTLDKSTYKINMKYKIDNDKWPQTADDRSREVLLHLIIENILHLEISDKLSAALKWYIPPYLVTRRENTSSMAMKFFCKCVPTKYLPRLSTIVSILIRCCSLENYVIPRIV